MWEVAYSKERPITKEPVGNDRYIVRRNITAVDGDDGPSYKYEEILLDENSLKVYEEIQAEQADVNEALIELASIISGE